MKEALKVVPRDVAETSSEEVVAWLLGEEDLDVLELILSVDELELELILTVAAGVHCE